jgi:hypothetical protein
VLAGILSPLTPTEVTADIESVRFERATIATGVLGHWGPMFLSIQPSRPAGRAQIDVELVGFREGMNRYMLGFPFTVQYLLRQRLARMWLTPFVAYGDDLAVESLLT